MKSDADSDVQKGPSQEFPSSSIATGGIGPFITWVTWEDADAGSLLRSSRRHRKGLQPLAVTSADTDPAVPRHAFTISGIDSGRQAKSDGGLPSSS
jgi:hypothetical protein